MSTDELKAYDYKKRGYNADIDPDKPVSNKEQKMLDLMVYDYKTRIEAYNESYPCRNSTGQRNVNQANSDSWKKLRKPNVAKRYKEMQEEMKEKLIEKGLWTRENAINELLSIIEENKKEQKRIDKSYKAQIDMLITKIEDETTPDKKEKLFIQMVELMKKVRNSQVNNSARLQAVQELNKMHGFNSQELIVKHDEEFEIDKKLAQMSIEELTAMLYKKDDEE